MDDASYCPDRTLHARYRKLGGGFSFGLDRHLLNIISFRLLGEGLTLLSRPVPFFLGTILRNLHSMCTSSLVSLISWVSTRVGYTTLPQSSFRD